ncbi:MAG: amino-acid N-acetyltransferase, partial [Gammaproteobacteria bacterium]|nr:amino-acid N-acetyltransferase [Gammaproteobacteria bacterium]
MTDSTGQPALVALLREASPYVHAHRGCTFVLCLAGEFVDDGNFAATAHDIALLTGLGVRVVLVHGARPQIERALKARGVDCRYHAGLRITDQAALSVVKEAAGAARVDIEAMLSSCDGLRVSSGNYITARPLGIRDGVDFGFTGEIRRVDKVAIDAALAGGELVLISPFGYSPTGEVFNIGAEETAATLAAELGAAKLIYFVDGPGVLDAGEKPVHQATLNEARELLAGGALTPAAQGPLREAVRACSLGVPRTHLIPRAQDGSLLLELYTRDGVGTLISTAPFDQMRLATVDDVGGILDLLRPLEEEGVLVRRSRDKLETEIDHFTVLVRDNTIIACGALYPLEGEEVAEVAALAVHPDYQRQGFGDAVLVRLLQRAADSGMRSVMVLT